MSIEITSNYILEIATPTPRRLTTYRGLTASGNRGLVVGGLYYASWIVDWPQIEEADTAPPLVFELSIGNAGNELTDLYSNKANYRKRVTIRKVKFTGAWHESFAPTFTTEDWFDGFGGRPSLRGERLVIEVHADMGRRGKSPRTPSLKVMTNAKPIAAGQKLSVLVRS